VALLCAQNERLGSLRGLHTLTGLVEVGWTVGWADWRTGLAQLPVCFTGLVPGRLAGATGKHDPVACISLAHSLPAAYVHCM
jgi:hypothetical protein